MEQEINIINIKEKKNEEENYPKRDLFKMKNILKNIIMLI